MITAKKKRERLWIRIVRVENGETLIVEPVNMDSTIGNLMDLRELLCKVYSPMAFDLKYEWIDADIVSPWEVRHG